MSTGTVKQETSNTTAQEEQCCKSPAFIDQIKQLITDQISPIVNLLNLLPQSLRSNAIFTAKVVAANMQALGDIVANAADKKNPHVTKDNMAIIQYLRKQPQVYQALVEISKKMNDEPSEKRTYPVLKASETFIKPLLV